MLIFHCECGDIAKVLICKSVLDGGVRWWDFWTAVSDRWIKKHSEPPNGLTERNGGNEAKKSGLRD